jgi:hypothetical protein
LETSLTPGDVTGNGIVDMADFDIIKANLFNTGMTRAEGDLTGGGVVDFADFRQWKANAGPGAASVSLFGAPEPTSLLLSMIACVVLAPARGFRRRMRS